MPPLEDIASKSHLLSSPMGGLAAFLGLCALSATTGRGLLRLFRLPADLPGRWELSPVIALALWAVTLGAGVGLGAPVRVLAWPVWTASLALAAYGLTAERALPGMRAAWPLAAAGVIAVAFRAESFWQGLAEYLGGDVGADSWAYISHGRYLWRHSRFTEGDLGPVYQYAAILSPTRHVTAALLALLSAPFGPGDTQPVSALLAAWTSFVLGCASALVGRAVGLPPAATLLYMTAATASGWSSNIVLYGNSDNGVALAFLPALAGCAMLLPPEQGGSAAAAALVSAAAAYTYPEFALAVMGGATIVLLERLRRDRPAALPRTLGLAAAITLVLIAPWARDLFRFFRMQVKAGLEPPLLRPGAGGLPGLVEWRYQPAAFWGLGAEHQQGGLPAAAMGVVLTILAVLGLLRLARRGHPSLAILALLFTLAAALCAADGYGYGAYKFILLGWWIFALGVVVGLDMLLAREARAAVPLVAAVAILAASPLHVAAAAVRAAVGTRRMGQFRKLEDITRNVGSRGVLLAVDDELLNPWAMYFLHDLKLHPGSLRGHPGRPGARPWMARSAQVPMKDLRFALTDDRFDAGLGGDPTQRPVWRGGPYRLWTLRPPWAAILDVENPNGVERGAHGVSLWLGDEPAVLDVLSNAGTLEVHLSVEPGPSQPHRSRYPLLVGLDGRDRGIQELRVGRPMIAVPVEAGRHRVTLQVLLRGEPLVRVEDDPRVRLARVHTLGLRVRPGSPSN